jgi:hypothetical protein
MAAAMLKENGFTGLLKGSVMGFFSSGAVH